MLKTISVKIWSASGMILFLFSLLWLNTFGIDFFLFTLGHIKPDYKTLRKASECEKIIYPKPDGHNFVR